MHPACGSQKTLAGIQSFLTLPRRISALWTGTVQGEFKSLYLQSMDCLISAPRSRPSTCLGSCLRPFSDCPCSALHTSWSHEADIRFTSVTLTWRALAGHLFLGGALPRRCLPSPFKHRAPRAEEGRTRWSLASPSFLEAI